MPGVERVSPRAGWFFFLLVAVGVVVGACSRSGSTTTIENLSSTAVEFDLGDIEVELGDGTPWLLHRRGWLVPSTSGGRSPVVFVLPLRTAEVCRDAETVAGAAGNLLPVYPCPEGVSEIRTDDGYLELAEALATAGYLSVVIDMNSIHVNPTDAAGTKSDGSDGLERVARVMLDVLSALQAGDGSDSLGTAASLAAVDTVAVIGHSHGGELAIQLPAVLARSGFSVSSVLALAPSTGSIGGVGADALTPLDLPAQVAMGVVVGTCDGMLGNGVPGLGLWHRLPKGFRSAPADWLVVPGATHAGFLNDADFQSGEVCEDGSPPLDSSVQRAWASTTAVSWLMATLQGAALVEPWAMGEVVNGPTGYPMPRIDRGPGSLIVVSDPSATGNLADPEPVAAGDATLSRCSPPEACAKTLDVTPYPGQAAWLVSAQEQGSVRFELSSPPVVTAVSVLIGSLGDTTDGLTVTLEDADGDRASTFIAPNHPALVAVPIPTGETGRQLLLSQIRVAMDDLGEVDNTRIVALEIRGSAFRIAISQVAVETP